MIRQWTARLLCLIPLIAASRADAHPFHTTIAEAEWNAESKCLEFAVKLSALDLEQVLRQRTGKIVHLETSPNVDRLIQSYLKQTFQVATPSSKSAEMRWVGKEVTLKDSWLYFEVRLPQGPYGAKFRNRIFFEHLPDQVNTINFQIGKQRQSLTFTREQAEQTIVDRSG